jgi:hypothetical protein
VSACRTGAAVARASAAALLAAVSVLGAACATAPIAPPADAASPTGGLGVTLWFARPETKQYEFYVVEPDGRFSCSGGLKAFERATDWNGRLTDDEAKRLRAIVDGAKWLTAAEPSRDDPKRTPVFEMLLKVPSGEREVVIRGADPAAEQAAQLLAEAAKRRFDRFMQRLPDAGTQPR